MNIWDRKSQTGSIGLEPIVEVNWTSSLDIYYQQESSKNQFSGGFTPSSYSCKAAEEYPLNMPKLPGNYFEFRFPNYGNIFLPDQLNNRILSFLFFSSCGNVKKGIDSHLL